MKNSFTLAFSLCALAGLALPALAQTNPSYPQQQYQQQGIPPQQQQTQPQQAPSTIIQVNPPAQQPQPTYQQPAQQYQTQPQQQYQQAQPSNPNYQQSPTYQQGQQDNSQQNYQSAPATTPSSPASPSPTTAPGTSTTTQTTTTQTTTAAVTTRTDVGRYAPNTDDMSWRLNLLGLPLLNFQLAYDYWLEPNLSLVAEAAWQHNMNARRKTLFSDDRYIYDRCFLRLGIRWAFDESSNSARNHRQSYLQPYASLAFANGRFPYERERIENGVVVGRETDYERGVYVTSGVGLNIGNQHFGKYTVLDYYAGAVVYPINNGAAFRDHGRFRNAELFEFRAGLNLGIMWHRGQNVRE